MWRLRRRNSENRSREQKNLFFYTLRYRRIKISCDNDRIWGKKFNRETYWYPMRRLDVIDKKTFPNRRVRYLVDPASIIC